MALPLLQSYDDAKKQKAYLLYMEGKGQRAIAAKVKKSERAVAYWSKTDGWEAERKARKSIGETPNVAAVAAEALQEAPAAATPAPDTPAPPIESRLVGMERMLAQQQYIAGLLSAALRTDIEVQVAAAAAQGKPLSRGQITVLVGMSNTLFAMERKAWCVPDKIETKDTTPQKVDEVRKLTDEQIDRELAELARAEGAATPPPAGEGTPESVN